MIDRIQTWLDIHPRTRFTGRITAASLAALLYVGLFTVGFAILGAVAAGVLILVVNLAGPIPFTSIDAVWGSWAGFLWLGAIAGAIVGLIRTLMRVVRTDPSEHRNRTVIIRDLVAQAIVAHRIGAESVDLRLGLLDGGDLRWTRSISLVGGPSASDQAFDLLTVQLANPSLTATDFLGDDQRRTWFEVISRTAEEIVIRRAAEGSATADAAAIITSAAQRARTILDETDDLVMTAIRAELRTAGSIRNRRFQTLMRPVVEERVEAEALF
ncbi:hypothetical protein [Microbacterium sp. LB12]|uniref:hypothetical protein n=1 Tax=Microbacterium sp. LB12 TaxID=3081270 RepID=UPI00301B2E24